MSAHHVLRKLQLIGAVVVAFEARGCMASDHRFQWMGIVTGFVQTEHAGPAAVIKILKSEAAGGIDMRDQDLGEVIHPIHDTCLQCLKQGVFILVR